MAVISPAYLQNLLYAIDKSYESLKKAYGDRESPGSALYNLSLAKILVRGGSDHELGLLPNYSHTAEGNYVVSPTEVTRGDGSNSNHFQISFPTISFVYRGVRGYVNSTTVKFNSKYGGGYEGGFAYVRGRDSHARINTSGTGDDRTTVFMVYIKNLQLNRDEVNNLYYYTGSLDYTTSHVVDKAGNYQSDPYVPPPPAPPPADGPYIPLAYIKPSRYDEGGNKTGIRLDLTRPYSLEQVHYAPQEEVGILFNLLPALISAESSILNQSSLNTYKGVFDSLSSHCNSRASISFRDYVYNNSLVVSKSLRELYSLLYNRDFILNFCSGSGNGTYSTTGDVALAKGRIIIQFNQVSNSANLQGALATYLIADKVKVTGKVGTTGYTLKLANYVNWPQTGTVGIRSSSSNGVYSYSLGAEGDTLSIPSSPPDVVPDEIYLLSEKNCVIPDNISAGASVYLANEDYFGFWEFVSPSRAAQIASNSSFVIRSV